MCQNTLIFHYLDGLNISQSLNGYHFLACVIEYQMKNPMANMNEFCCHCADRYHTSVDSIKSDIRYALARADKPCSRRTKEFVRSSVNIIKQTEMHMH